MSVFLALLLTACGTLGSERVQTIVVDRPVVQSCIKAKDIPARPAPPVIRPDADVLQRAEWVGIRLKQQASYEVKLLAALVACATEE
jgi:hypothetical protein